MCSAALPGRLLLPQTDREEIAEESDREEDPACTETASSDDIGRSDFILALYTLQLLDCFDADFNELIRTGPECGDYSPFPSKLYALAYMLVHSPRPMVMH